MRGPDFIIIGETKCGTTSLYNYLIQHPQILETYGNGENYHESYKTKELRFFDKFYAKGVDWYRSCFPDVSGGNITGEATPMYFYRIQTAQRIKKYFPDVKLIIVLRNPADRFVSQFYHNYKWVPGFSDRYRNIDEFLNSSMDSDHYILQKGMYYYTLINWLNYFSLNQFYIFSSEELFENPSETYQKITDFLDVDRFDLKEFGKFRSNQYDNINDSLRNELKDYYRISNQRLFNLIGKTIFRPVRNLGTIRALSSLA